MLDPRYRYYEVPFAVEQNRKPEQKKTDRTADKVACVTSEEDQFVCGRLFGGEDDVFLIIAGDRIEYDDKLTLPTWGIVQPANHLRSSLS